MYDTGSNCHKNRSIGFEGIQLTSKMLLLYLHMEYTTVNLIALGRKRGVLQFDIQTPFQGESFDSLIFVFR